MPKGSKVDSVYQAVKATGASPGKAARIAQSQTGEALATGKPPPGKGGKVGPFNMGKVGSRGGKPNA